MFHLGDIPEATNAGYVISEGDWKEMYRNTLRAHGLAIRVGLVPDVTLIKTYGQDLSHIALTLLYNNKDSVIKQIYENFYISAILNSNC